jgi:S-DNA-T family DNA segregation ATPase FtsK/SpoIIIE
MAGTKGSTTSRGGAKGRPRAGTGRRRPSPAAPKVARGPLIEPDTLRSIVGIVLIVLGAITLASLLLAGQGVFGEFVTSVLRPWFGQGAWLLGVLLIVAGAMVERGSRLRVGWVSVLAGGLLVFVAGEGLIHLLSGRGTSPEELSAGGGRLGEFMSSMLTDLVGPVGAFLVLAGMLVAGILLLFEMTLKALVEPVSSGGRAVAGLAGSALEAARTRAAMEGDVAAPRPEPPSRGRARADAAPGRPERTEAIPVLPQPMPSPAPLSQTVWAGTGPGDYAAKPPARRPDQASGNGTPALGTPVVPGAAAAGTAVATAAGARPPSAIVDAGPVIRPPRTWDLPPVDLLDVGAPPANGQTIDHERNRRIIEEKLRSFQIPAQVVGTNSGPVVTQYEVKPDVRVKLSRIEGLSDDLAMALAARSIRIEAPIPGKDVVGIEIPNHAPEVVGFRRLYEDARMEHATSKLTFALGRDVSGKAYAVDLARMPHLLIAGATGSGKSVCVNALITSLLMRATPSEVELVLVDLKRVELAAYADLPHLKAPVIMEPNQARAALAWAVGQMEDRYKILAARGERNIGAYNASPRVEEDERLPYLVLIIDELADLMMREGRKVEDPIVKLAQKARAVGIHLVLATQRPSVNVVTGLIKANVPSRIAFAMASNVDSRTVLDAPGAEDLIGRGDMLYQPSDLPRPVRLQGVFLSDAEVHAVCDLWRAQEPQPTYDPDVLAGAGDDGEDGGGGQFGWLSKMAEDELTPRAAELVLQTGKASTSMMQTKLKVGFNRASRLMDELERFGIVGPQDPRNPAVPRQVYGPENWLRGPEDVDDL